ncbi:hypothetical protein KAFR_0D02750 [Kazachstania africana CBS 2517]|uniref:Uncharacterized protein n=1 Tax=Kazachstania africana (strain ATCC 22294 / BCRC 22015 / CBS 2517 / CECT 1963 / NBRC 1671 / NRRL Y-8276) TaxID=1071382 RepID=H2AU73_KAZAF|nr:hypothetical protein KAFR_0D02750 [Kazachstania africana CBS 2517]CCF57923.1 hypothetical protein KAFR_0D02750 [Kazachstania africana CBS 2517]
MPSPDSIENFEVSKGRIVKDILAGTFGGVAQVLVGQPFDTTKVRLQTSPHGTRTFEIIKRLVKNEGILAFYKGTLTPLVGVGACVSVQFGVNESMKRWFRYHVNDGKDLKLSQFYMSGMMGGLCNSFLCSPIEHVRIRLQTQSHGTKEFNGPWDCVKKLVQNRSLMKGLPVMMLRAGHGLGCYFLTYEALIKNELGRRSVHRNEIESWKLCVFGSVAGTMLWLCIYPLDVIKSMIQTDNLMHPKFNNSMMKATKTLYRKEGLKGFFKGFTPTLLRASPANGATFLTFEMAMRVLG